MSRSSVSSIKSGKLSTKQIIMNFTRPPSIEELGVIAQDTLDILPEELAEFCEDLQIQVEEMADEVLEQELDLDDPFELLAIYKSGKEISPGVEKKVPDEEDILILFRRPILDAWCETMDDLAGLVRQIMIEEIGNYYDFTEEEIEEMTKRHYQGLFESL